MWNERGALHRPAQIGSCREDILLLLRPLPGKISRASGGLPGGASGVRRWIAHDRHSSGAAGQECAHKICGRDVRRKRLRLPDVSRGAIGQACRLSALRYGARAGDAGGGNPGGVHLPHASGNCAAGAGQLSDLWHGAGAAHRHRAGRGQSRAARHDPPLLDQSGPDCSAAGDRDGSYGPRHANAAAASLAALDRIAAGHAGGAVGRRAVL